MTGLGLFLSVLVSGDAALTVPLPEQARDAILVRSAADAKQLQLLLPREDGSLELRVLPPLPSPIQGMVLVDADGDRDLDLAMLLQDGQVVLWDGDGRGEFFSHEAPDAGLHAHHGMAVPSLQPAQERALRAVLLERPSRPELDVRIPARVPASFDVRAAVSGRFTSDEAAATAVVETGSRPRLLLFAADGSEPVEMLAPNTTFTVFVGQAGLSFTPNQVTINPGDVVHWVWSIGGHTVNSGTSCTSNNLFCSPNNTNCSTNLSSNTGFTYDRTFAQVGTFPYFCRPHCAFGMTGEVFVGTTPGGILEATNLKLGKSGTSTTFTYTPACGATSHALYFGDRPLTASPVWTDSLCIDASGSHTAALADPSPEHLQYFVVVGQTAAAEGSYGKNSQDVERSEATKVGACDLPQQISTTCP